MSLIKKLTSWKVPVALLMLSPLASMADVKVLNTERILDNNQRVVFIDNNACKYLGEVHDFSPDIRGIVVTLKQCGDTVEHIKMMAYPTRVRVGPVPAGDIWTLKN
ncbi:hypothetical protein NRS63_004145 [Salmonella enterica]|nr:hypothetical protein [Salmonella enterica]EJO6345785.1 hypothetical protein [Salmonella enterica]